jgi:transcription antitermination factor NusG
LADQQTIALLTVQASTEQTVRALVRARGMQAYVPQYLVNLPRTGMTAKALFPGYVFVWVLDQWRTLLNLMHVRDFLRCGKEITPVNPAVVDELRKREGPTGYIKINSTFLVGQTVALRKQSTLTGVYAGMSNEYKARVLFTLLGVETEVQLHEAELQPA